MTGYHAHPAWGSRPPNRDGARLLTLAQWHFALAALPPGETREKDLSWFDGALLAPLSPDGRTVFFSDRGGVSLRRTDGSPAVRLGPGGALDLSPDGKWALAGTDHPKATLALLPTGAGQMRSVPIGELGPVAFGGGFFPDGRRLYVNVLRATSGSGSTCRVSTARGDAP